MKRIIAVLAVLFLVPLVVASGAGAEDEAEAQRHRPRPPRPEPIEYIVDESTLPFEAVAGHEDSRREWGVLRGAGWRIEIPTEWNGELVMWAHGFRGTDTSLFFNPEEVPFRQYLLDNGYAWAASTYSKNDYNVGTAVTDTHRLVRHFGKVADHRPKRTYIAGVSMGGHVTAASIERHPHLYDGAMPVCGVLGDFELFDFFFDFNTAARQIALGVSEFPAPDDYATVVVPEIKAALEAAPGAWPAVLNERGEAFKQLVENRSGGDRPNFDEAWFFWNATDFMFDLGGGDGTLAERPGSVIDNRRVFYETDLIAGQSNAIEEELNAGIVRVRPDRGARRNTPRSPSPELRGRIRVPVLTMHNLGDLFVPFLMETEYERTVASRGRSHLLVQRAIRGVGHCGFTTTEYEQGFGDLVTWVETGERPAGDAVGDPAAVATPTFGCRFTDQTPGGHLFPAPCPESSS